MTPRIERARIENARDKEDRTIKCQHCKQEGPTVACNAKPDLGHNKTNRKKRKIKSGMDMAKTKKPKAKRQPKDNPKLFHYFCADHYATLCNTFPKGTGKKKGKPKGKGLADAGFKRHSEGIFPFGKVEYVRQCVHIQLSHR